MIYVCVPSFDEAPTVGLLLWKIREIFREFPREYQLLVVDDGSTDHTRETLEGYAKVLPLTVLRHETRQGYARSVEHLLQAALERTDRPKRDAAVLMHADFRHGPAYLPELVKGIESGADLVVAEAPADGHATRGLRLVRRFAPVLLRRGVRIPGVKDTVSGFMAVRLVTVRNAFRAQVGDWLGTDGWAANAELQARLAADARRVTTVTTIERHDLRQRPSRVDAWPLARELWRAGRLIRVPRRTGARDTALQPEDAA